MSCKFEYNNRWYTEAELKVIFIQQNNDLISSKASPVTLSIMREFLSRIGVSYEQVSQIEVNGIKQDANAIAKIMDNLVQVVYGKEDTALTEEAMHFAVELLEKYNPTLYKQLFNKIGSYNIYSSTLSTYKDRYKTKEGKPDIIKIKKEAIAKLLTEVIIQQTEGFTEKPELLIQTQSWWSTIKDWLKSLFNKSNTNPFREAAQQIIAGEVVGTTDSNEIFQQAKTGINSVQDAANKIKDINDKTSLQGQGTDDRHYTFEGKRVKQSVTEKVKSKAAGRFANRKVTPQQKAYEDELAQWGTKGHADMENIIKESTDANGVIKPRVKNPSYTSNLPDDIYTALGDYVADLLSRYKDGTVILSETKGFNLAKNDLAGTIDFIAIEPDDTTGVKVDILDWKFKSLDKNKFDDIPWYSDREWKEQMGEYVQMLKSYGLRPEQIRKTRMVPFIPQYTPIDFNDRSLGYNMTSLEVGNIDSQKETKKYLLPVASENESTGNKTIDDLLVKLRGLYSRQSGKKVEAGRKDFKVEELNKLFSAIRQLQIQQNLEPLVEQGKVLNKRIQRLVDKYANEYSKDMSLKDESNASKREEIVRSIREAIDDLGVYVSLDTDLHGVTKEEEIEKDITEVAKEARLLLATLKKIDADFAQQFVVDPALGETVGKDLTSAEKVMQYTKRNFATLSSLGTVALRTLYRLSERIYENVTIDRDEQRKRILEHEKSFLDKAKAKGIDISNADKAFSSIIQKNKDGKAEFLDEIQEEFYTTLKEKIESSDTKWIKANLGKNDEELTFEEYIKKTLQHKLDYIDNDKPYLGTDDSINQQKIKDKQVYEDKYSLTSKDGAYSLYSELKKFPKKDKWQTKQYKALTVEEKATLNYFISRNQWLQDIGYLPDFVSVRKFIPFAQKSIMENWTTSTDNNYMEKFLQNFSVHETDTLYGEKDPITGKIMDKVPTFMTRDPFADKKDYQHMSVDLFKIYDALNRMGLEYQYRTEAKEQALQLLRIEQSKRHLRTTNANKVIIKEGTTDELETDNGNEVNSKLYEDMMKSVIFGQRFIDNNDQTFGSVNKLQKVGRAITNKVYKLIGKEELPEAEFENRKLSLYKTVDTINRSFQMKQMGLNILVPISNFIGGNLQVFITAKKFFTKQDFWQAQMKVTTKSFTGTEGKIFTALIDYMMPFLQDENSRKNKLLSVSEINKIYLSDLMMRLQSGTDELIQYSIAGAMLKNAIIRDGKVVNIREWLRSQPEYQNKLSMTQEERRAYEQNFEKQAVELQKESLLKIATIKDDKLIIPGIDSRKDPSILDYRSKIRAMSKDALGGLGEEDRRRINMDVFGSSFMIFKNWIPRLMEVRFGGLKYNEGLESFEWGRMAIAGKLIGQEGLSSISNLSNLIKGNDKGIAIIRKMYESKQKEYFERTGKQLEMGEVEFSDMVRDAIQAAIKDVSLLLMFMAALIAAKALPPEDDTDPHVKNFYKLSLRALDKITDELSFYYNPLAVQQILNGSVFPSLGLLSDAARFITNFSQQAWGWSAEELGFKEYGEKQQKSAKPIKYIFKNFPIGKVMMDYVAVFSPDLAKELGVQISTQSRLK